MEIERKFLVDISRWRVLIKPNPQFIAQGYLGSDSEKTIRVSVKGDRGFLTIKGKTEGISRAEYEYEIPVDEARRMLTDFCSSVIEKDRFEIHHDQHTWEVDVFHGMNTGLILAEIELAREDEVFAQPEWIASEVSYDERYFNAVLARNPYCNWSIPVK
jgi:adenylate cyclase